MQSHLPLQRFSDHSARNGNRLILSVDDEPVILFTRERLLEAKGYDVISAPDGRKALYIFSTLPVDLVLLDFAMPEMDGGAVAQEIKRRNSKIPVIMISAMQVPADALAYVDCFIPKAEGPQILFEKIKDLLTPLPSRRLGPLPEQARFRNGKTP